MSMYADAQTIMDRALAARYEELTDVKVRGGILFAKPAIMSVPGVDSVQSTSADSTSQIMITYVEGTIECDRDGLLYASIPQNGNWSVTVDGEPAEIRLVGECMIGVELTEGSHVVAYHYHNQAFALGWKISLGCAAVFVLLAYFLGKPKEKTPAKRGKFQK